MAKVVKKPSKKPRYSLESVTEDESGSEEDGDAGSPKKAKGSANNRGAAKDKKPFAKKPKVAATDADEEEEYMDGNGGMQFDIAA